MSGRDEAIQRSDRFARVLLELGARFQPEATSALGFVEADPRVLDLEEGWLERHLAALGEARRTLEGHLSAETDPVVRLDLQLLIADTERDTEGLELARDLEVPYVNVSGVVFSGIHCLLDARSDPDRHPAALERLRRYAGLADGGPSLTGLAMQRFREAASRPGLVQPFRGEIEKDLGQAQALLDGVDELFSKQEVAGYAEPLGRLREQVEAYQAFLRDEVLRQSRDDFRLPAELYAYRLRRTGVDLPVDELQARARCAYQEIRNEMRTLAPLVARELGLASAEPAAVLAELKKQQLAPETIVDEYRGIIARLEDLTRQHGVVTLPRRPMEMRLASTAETAAIPSPHMRPPRLVGNTGEMGEFVLPQRLPPRPGGEDLVFDDFTFRAAAWTIAAHEARPGHELQFAAMVERGVPLARAAFAFNSVNVEGWALYMEAEMKPLLPLEGQLGALQHRLLRAARAFLDPGLHGGTLTTHEAERILRDEVMVSKAMTRQEIERYTFWAPAQATSYFAGYCRLMETRAELEARAGARFDRRRFHDFILDQGLLPPALLRQAVLDQLLPRLAAGAAEGSR